MPTPDLEPAAAELSALIADVPDELLYRPTPCPAYRIGDLIDHVGGVDLPGEVAGLVAVDELVVHGWDIARAREQRLDPDPGALEAVHGFLAQAAAANPGPGADQDGPFGPPVAVPDDAPLLDRVVGLAGRDPAWPAPVPAYQASESR